MVSKGGLLKISALLMVLVIVGARPCLADGVVESGGNHYLNKLEEKRRIFGKKAVINTAGKSKLVERPRQELFKVSTLEQLPPQTRELADQLEILPLIEELKHKNTLSTERKQEIRQEILDTVWESYFDAASVHAEAERERVHLEVLRSLLSDRRDDAINKNNAINFMTSGTLNTIGSVLGFPKNALPFPGNLNQMLSGVVSTGMSMYALKQGEGQKIVGPGVPTVVAELFGRKTGHHTGYPESVWRFFHSHSFDDPTKTRAELLELNWIERGWLEPHGSKREDLKLDIVSGMPINDKVITIDDLTDQINIIADIQAVSGLMAHHLRDIMRMVDSDELK